MSNKVNNIQDSELEVMQVLWAADGPMPLAQIRAILHERCHWEDSTIKTLLRRLRKANNGRADGSDLPSFFRMAANPRMHWLLRPAEIELARAYRLLPAEDLRTSAEELIDRSLHMPPATPHPRMNLFASNF